MPEQESKNLTYKQLKKLNHRMFDRDRDILREILKCRYITTAQIRRLHFLDAATPSAGLRAASRALSKLKDYGLIEHLERRIGGVRAGSGSFVWCLQMAGLKILALNDNEEIPTRKRFFEPSPQFLTHTLAITETYIRLTEMSGTELINSEIEPDCWRNYPSIGGTALTLKPDLYAVTASGEYEDHWFFEIDLATESVPRVLKKCQQYLEYYHNGAEQRRTGIFPIVVWLVPDEKRKSALMYMLTDNFKNTPAIFRIITPDEFETLVRNGSETN